MSLDVPTEIVASALSGNYASLIVTLLTLIILLAAYTAKRIYSSHSEKIKDSADKIESLEKSTRLKSTILQDKVEQYKADLLDKISHSKELAERTAERSIEMSDKSYDKVMGYIEDQKGKIDELNEARLKQESSIEGLRQSVDYMRDDIKEARKASDDGHKETMKMITEISSQLGVVVGKLEDK